MSTEEDGVTAWENRPAADDNSVAAEAEGMAAEEKRVAPDDDSVAAEAEGRAAEDKGIAAEHRRVRRQRRSLSATVLVVTVGLAVVVALLISAVEESLPDIPGLDYRVVQVGLVALAFGFSLYAGDRERSLRTIERELAEEREESERLRMMDDLKNTFLRSVSHDLRTPLTVIVGMAHLLEGRGDQLPAERLRDAAQRIGFQARRLDGMLGDLLDLERVARGMLQLQAEQQEVADVVRRTVENIDVGRHEVDLQLDAVPMRVDATLVERIVDNLVRNAVKYSGQNARIWVQVRREGDGVLLGVDDDGPGVPDAVKEEIFDLFGRGAPPVGVTGTGIGLSLVRQFAQLHGGRAWVEDRPEGGGAAFRVFLAEAPASEQVSASV